MNVMSNKRIAVIGRGTAGSQAIIHFLRYMPDHEIQWYFDNTIPPQAVGEGSTLSLPKSLFENINFNYSDLDKIDSTLKLGIYKEGWGNGNAFMHDFPPPTAGLHFNAVALQNYIVDYVKDKVQCIDTHVADDVDADYIMDCRGKPQSYDEFNKSKYIPVNAAYVTQCQWDYPRFHYSLTVARPYGWVFGIPSKNRCSVGYLFNRNINTLDEVKDDVNHIFEQYDLTPSTNTNYLEFENYYRKQNYTDRVVYNGNTSFFLEPLEASSIHMMHTIQRGAYDLWNGNIILEEALHNYTNTIHEIETMIMLHYYAGSKYDTPFWAHAQDRGEQAINKALKTDRRFVDILHDAMSIKQANYATHNVEYGSWWVGSFCQNIIGLNLNERLWLQHS